MVKGGSLLIIGISIIISSIFSLTIEFINPEPILDELDFLSDYNFSMYSLYLGGFLMLIGGPKFINERQKKSEKIESKRVSIVWQVIGSIFPGFDLLVMYRIKKLRLGLIVFAVQYGIYVSIYSTDLSLSFEGRLEILIAITYAIIVYTWSKKWNKQFPKNSINKKIK